MLGLEAFVQGLEGLAQGLAELVLSLEGLGRGIEGFVHGQYIFTKNTAATSWRKWLLCFQS